MQKVEQNRGNEKGRRRRIPDDTAVFQNWANKGDVESNES